MLIVVFAMLLIANIARSIQATDVHAKVDKAILAVVVALLSWNNERRR
jgi:hypothetical protein